MYLMNAPPVAVTRTEWRTCGTPGGYSLPLCLNDSDSDLSTRGTPISDKVQMIIESLRSTQSSVEMGDEKEGKVLSGQDGHPQVCKVAMGSFVGANSKAQGPIVNQLKSPTICNNSHDSDSDDSVDRGIEEAILEYLKEKDGPKQKSETCSEDFQPSKIPRSPSPIPGISRLNSESCSFFTSSKDLPKNIITEKLITPTTYPIKKYIKHKASVIEGSFTKQESSKPPSRSDVPIDQTNHPSKYLSDLIKLSANPKEDSDSSSDDGIEEAIQKFQMEKNLLNKTETQNTHTLSEDSDSTSDDGIEEAIRRYQLEQLKKKSILKPLFNKAKKTVNKFTTKEHHGPNTGITKKHKLKKKRNKMKKEVLSGMSSNTLLDSIKGNVPHSFKIEALKGQSTHPKTNTTAELMCAEAILDISKTVMPGAFQQAPGFSNTSSLDACAQTSPPHIKLEDESDDSSIDSEDGIEQEIRRFLEQKAQMQKQTVGSAVAPTPSDENEEAVKTKSSKKPGRLSLTKKRKQKTEKLNFCTMSALSNVKGTISLADSNDESTPPASPISKQQRKEQSGDKSSSLDSDEDLDLAIKDLLKTKKKLKKKTRDLKRKPEKCIKKEMQGSVSLSKKSKPDPLKQSILRQSEKTNYELSYSTLPKDNISEKTCNTSQESNMKSESESYKGTDLTFSPLSKPMKDEDSSVDSDDSIELEIRKFLAEKAKVATSEHHKNQTVSTNGISPVCAENKTEDVKQENQRAEIPSKNILLPGQLTEYRPVTENILPKEKVLLLSPKHLALKHSPAGAQALSSSPTCSQSLLEPADGAGAAANATRTQKIGSGNIQGASLSKEGQSVLNPNLTASQSASIKWRQSLGLPITDAKIRTPFQVTSSKMSDTSLTTRPYQTVQNFKVQNPVWSSAKTITASFSRSNEMGFHRHALSFLSSARQHPGPFTQALASGRSSQFPIEEETKSMVHISKDKSVYVELETNRTNHVQVRSRDRSEGKECQDVLTANTRERKSGKMEEKEVCPNIKEENFIDEADYESGNESNQEKKQGLSTLSLSSAIDPGFTFKPCIALTTEERSERFSRRCMDNKCRKGIISWRSGNLQQSIQHVKRKLQFVPVLRRKEATSLQI
ncbi:protein phosphatase 1 regulatory subunit 26 [Boleophthalmus pectinirostris]|uniref:protein phosphatase 1 regulatory subunit 26 n=1 Tax=Boleophthalmus pectinirostris TaxID=150288 RepID=UPI00243078B6|nr:protein phosphatase 1 regulatory subunit 26 [Boleophthalmus pectinirostris]